MKQLIKLARQLLVIILAMLPATALAQAYGQGVYNGSKYGAKTITLGPIGPIPITGATIGATIAAAALSIAVGLVVWSAQRRKRFANYT